MSRTSIKTVLLVEDNQGDARLLREMFDGQDSHLNELAHVESMSEAEKYLAGRAVDIILLDLGLPDARGLEGVRRAHASAPGVPLVVLAGLDEEALALQALQEGAQDYFIKGQIETCGLLRTMRYAIERKTMEEALFVEKERTQVTLNCNDEGVACTDISGNITLLNLAAERMTGWSGQEAAGWPLDKVFKILDAPHREIIPNPMEMAVGQNRTVHQPLDRILVRRDGFETLIEDSVAPIHDRGGQATGAVIVFRDMSATRAMALELAHLPQHDFLTGLPNGTLLNDRVNHAIAVAERHMNKIAVLFLDLDGFKHINDSLGHTTGDKLLQSVAKRLLDCTRASDTVSRQGGDEFVVLLEVEEWEDAAIVTRKMMRAVAEPHSVDQHDLHVTTSIGVSIYPEDGPDAETLIKNADTAMHQAKEDGRQSYQFFKPSLDVRAVEPRSMRGESAVRHATERERTEETQHAGASLQQMFLSHVSHELRTPLTAIYFFTTNVLDGLFGDLNPQQREHLTFALDNVQQLKDMVSDLLDITRVDAHKLIVEPQHANPVKLIAEALSTCRKNAAVKNISLRSDVAPGLPFVWADPARVRQILINLIDNAIKFTPDAGIISVGSRPVGDDGFLCLSVSDTGCGISPENLQIVFDRLAQLKGSAEANRSGMGLGLFISKELVLQQGGRIWVESQLGHGSTFYFTLPVFSLAKVCAPVFAAPKLESDCVTLIAVDVVAARGEVQADILPEIRKVLERCIHPGPNVVLPSMSDANPAGTFFIVASTDPNGVEVIASRIGRELQRVDHAAKLKPVISTTTLCASPGQSREEQIGEFSAQIEQWVQTHLVGEESLK